MQVGLLGLFLTVSGSTLFGLIISGLLTSGKVEDLYTRLHWAEAAIQQQNDTIMELVAIMSTFLSEIAAGRKIEPASGAVLRANEALGLIVNQPKAAPLNW